MLFNIRPLSYTLIVYLFSLYILFMLKPLLCFTKDNKMKSWGIGKNKTLFPIYIISMIISIILLFTLTILI